MRMCNTVEDLCDILTHASLQRALHVMTYRDQLEVTEADRMQYKPGLETPANVSCSHESRRLGISKILCRAPLMLV
jgi:hypothetical protein